MTGLINNSILYEILTI